MNILPYFALILIFFTSPLQCFLPPADPTPHLLTTPEMAARDGYPMETHYVTTVDGYILGIHRIPYSYETAFSLTTRPVVIMHHGIGMSSSCWFLNSPGKRLPYMLVDAGYDVWFANIRGNVYSRNHSYLSPDEDRFWEFSCQEMALFDLPAVVDYVLARTGVEKVSYVGHSMGTTIFFIMTSVIPSYNDKIQVAVALAPISFANHMTCTPALLLAPMCSEPGPATEAVVNIFSIHGEFFPDRSWWEKLTILACTPFMIHWSICSLPAFVTFGFDYPQLNLSIVDDVWGHIPQGSSLRTFIHYGQWINSKRFCMYDYGVVKNRLIYNSDSPPDFPVDRITAPLYLLSAPNDLLAMPDDLEALRSRLTGVDEVFIEIDYPTFNHLDFLIAIDANQYVNYPVVRIINSHNGKQ